MLVARNYGPKMDGRHRVLDELEDRNSKKGYRVERETCWNFPFCHPAYKEEKLCRGAIIPRFFFYPCTMPHE